MTNDIELKVNDRVKTPYGIGLIQGQMNGSIMVRIPIDESNKHLIGNPNVIGRYTSKSRSALWCFYPDTVEVIDDSPKKRRKKRRKKG